MKIKFAYFSLVKKLKKKKFVVAMSMSKNLRGVRIEEAHQNLHTCFMYNVHVETIYVLNKVDILCC